MGKIKSEKSITTNQSVEKAFKIIELMSQYKAPMMLQEISKELGMHPTTVLRFLYTLMQCGYVAQEEETSRYYLTLRICFVAEEVKANNRIVRIAKPYLQALSETLNESVCIAIENDMSITYVDFIDGPDKILKSMQRIGKIAPMHCTGIGKLLLLNKDEEEIDLIIRKKGMTKFTEKTLATKESLMNELKKIKKVGYAFDDEECEMGAKCIAFPVRDYTGKIVAGVSVTGSIFKLTDDFLKLNKVHLDKAALEISRVLGYK